MCVWYITFSGITKQEICLTSAWLGHCHVLQAACIAAGLVLQTLFYGMYEGGICLCMCVYATNTCPCTYTHTDLLPEVAVLKPPLELTRPIDKIALIATAPRLGPAVRSSTKEKTQIRGREPKSHLRFLSLQGIGTCKHCSHTRVSLPRGKGESR